MSPVEYHGRQYKVVRGSDVQRDGMYLELWSATNPDVQLFEVFYSDVTHNLIFSAFSQEDVPIEVLEEFMRQARWLLTPTTKNAEQEHCT
jgi:hypothetical protein